MTNIISLCNFPKDCQSAAQKTFNRLTNKIKTLQNKLDKTQKQLDEALLFYYGQVHPVKRALSDTLTELVKIIYVNYKRTKLFSKKDRKILKQLLINKTGDIFALNPFGKMDPEIRSIIEELEGVNFNELLSDAVNDIKNGVSEMFQEFDLDVDLSKVDSTDDEDTIMRKVFEAIEEARSKHHDFAEERIIPPKSKQELQREIKEKELEALRKKGLGTIYKQLAKALHPDLELDPIQKLEKETIMKRLTSAYENEDLHTLLSIELEWMSRFEKSGKQKRIQSDEQLRIYSSILTDQAAQLQDRIDEAHLHPKYMPISDHFTRGVSHGMLSLEMMLNSINRELEVHRSFIQASHDEDLVENIRLIIQICRS